MGSNAHEKRMPQQFLNATNKQIGHLLSGYLEGDGSVSKTDLRICFDTVSKGLLKDIDFLFAQLHIFVKNKTYTKQPGQKLKDFYLKKNKQIPEFTITKGIIQSKFVKKASKYIVFLSRKKQNILNYLVRNKTFRNLFLEYDDEFFFDEIISVKTGRKKPSYCLNVPGNKVVVNNILTKQCDGDESCVLLLLDAFLNFSQKYLPKKRGSTMDAPIVLTSALNPAEVDDMVFDMDIATNYNLNFYKACKEYKMPWDVKVDKVGDHLDDEKKYKNYGFTHPTDNINDGVLCSVYKTLPTMEEKLKGQMELAEKIRAVDTSGVAKLVIEKHFIKDIRGNLRKFSQQQFRCVKCNEKFRRPPLSGICTNCTGKIIFTISEGSVIKYLEPSLSLAKNYELDDYIMQTLNLTKQMIEEVFGKDKEKQAGLGDWFA